MELCRQRRNYSKSERLHCCREVSHARYKVRRRPNEPAAVMSVMIVSNVMALDMEPRGKPSPGRSSIFRAAASYRHRYGISSRNSRNRLPTPEIPPRHARPHLHRDVGDAGVVVEGDDLLGRDDGAVLRADEHDLIAERGIGVLAQIEPHVLERGRADDGRTAAADEGGAGMELRRAVGGAEGDDAHAHTGTDAERCLV